METITWNISIKNILEDNRELFCKQNWLQTRDHCYQVVNQILQCNTKAMGFTSYKCEDCWDIKHVCFTCKSRFCNCCSKAQSDKRLTRLMTRWPPALKYYHLAFTIPEELRDFFKRHRIALKLLPQIAAQNVQFFFQTKHKAKGWIVAVIHTFWAKGNRNPHVHLIITAWGMKKQDKYKAISYIPYKLFIKSRKTCLLARLKRWNKENNTKSRNKNLKLINKLYKQKDPKDEEKKKSWYLYFSKKAESFQKVVSYIGRYLKRPIIAQSRILWYNGKTVTYQYKDKYDNEVKVITCTALEFIWLLVQHIPQKGFHMIYYFWLFANRCKKKHLAVIKKIFNSPIIKHRVAKNFRERMYYFLGKDPFRCSCGWCYQKYAIFINGYKPIYWDYP